MFERHHLKVLNLGLILYLCFGTILFDLLSFDKIAQQQQFEEPSKQVNLGQRGHDASKAAPSLEAIRLSSARRMWNITNQLNILYESNWTLLVLEELVEFERHLVKALSEVTSSQGQDALADYEVPELEVPEQTTEKGDGTKGPSKSAEQQNQAAAAAAKSAPARRSKSIKRSIVHSLTTITTIGE